MKIPHPCLSVVVNFNDGNQNVIVPSSKVDEWEDSYEFTETVGEGDYKRNNLHVIFKSEIRNIVFTSK